MRSEAEQKPTPSELRERAVEKYHKSLKSFLADEKYIESHVVSYASGWDECYAEICRNT